MTETLRKMFGFYLEQTESDRLNRIAAAMSRELGLTVSRSDAVARLINRFELPALPVDRTIDATTEKAA